MTRILKLVKCFDYEHCCLQGMTPSNLTQASEELTDTVFVINE
jgi:hypothetical protein